MYLLVGTHVFPVHVAAYARVNHGMIEGGVEDMFLVVGAARHGHFAQGLVPHLLAAAYRLVEIPCAHLRTQVLFRILQTGE